MPYQNSFPYDFKCDTIFQILGTKIQSLKFGSIRSEKTYPDGTVVQIVNRDGIFDERMDSYQKVKIYRPGDSEPQVFSLTNRGRKGFKGLNQVYPPKALQVISGSSVVDLGCGGGRFTEELRSEGVSAQGVDIILDPRQRLTGHFHEQNILGETLRFADSSQDIVFSSFSVFYYAQNSTYQMQHLINEIHRILKPGGVLRIAPANTALIKRLLQSIPGKFHISAQKDFGFWSFYSRNSYFELKKQ